jgi:hypothetical protein
LRLVISTMGHQRWGHYIYSDETKRMRVMGR